MELELRRGGRTARIDTLGAELVSYRDEGGLEYIWGGDPAYWAGRNPLLFPIVGSIRNDVAESAEGVRGDTSSAPMKPATLENGVIIQVPLFIKAGDVVRIRTEDETYLGRA